MTGFNQLMTFLVIPLLILIMLIIVLAVIGVNPVVLTLLGDLGTASIILFALAYAVFFDSKKRWPGNSWFTRFSRVLTFYRG